MKRPCDQFTDQVTEAVCCRKQETHLTWALLSNKVIIGASQVALVVKNLPANAGDRDSVSLEQPPYKIVDQKAFFPQDFAALAFSFTILVSSAAVQNSQSFSSLVFYIRPVCSKSLSPCSEIQYFLGLFSHSVGKLIGFLNSESHGFPL